MGKKEESVYKIVAKRHPSLGLPPSLAEFKRLFPGHKKFDRESFLMDFADTLIHDLGGRMDFLYYRTYPGDMATFNTESNFLRAGVGKERLFKAYMRARTVQLGLLNALDDVRLGADDNVLADAIAAALKFFREFLWKEFSELLKVVIEGWKGKVDEKREAFQPSYIR